MSHPRKKRTKQTFSIEALGSPDPPFHQTYPSPVSTIQFKTLSDVSCIYTRSSPVPEHPTIMCWLPPSTQRLSFPSRLSFRHLGNIRASEYIFQWDFLSWEIRGSSLRGDVAHVERVKVWIARRNTAPDDVVKLLAVD